MFFLLFNNKKFKQLKIAISGSNVGILQCQNVMILYIHLCSHANKVIFFCIRAIQFLNAKFLLNSKHSLANQL